MDAEERNVYRSFRRVQEYLAARHLGAESPQLGKQSQDLDAVIAQLSKEMVDQEAGHRLTKAESANQRGLRGALQRQHMLPVSRVAREVFGVSGMDKALRMPSAAASSEALVSAARAMAESAEAHAPVFVEHGLLAEFATRLRDAASALDASLGARDGTRRRRVTATAAVRDQLKRGRRAVRLLNAILAPRLAGDAEQLAAWENVKRIKPAFPAPAVAEAAPVAPAVAKVA